MKRIKLSILCAASLLFCPAQQVEAQTPAFPTAEGYGMYSVGGRGGAVVAVTNLEDDVNLEGSLRWALAQHTGKPLTVVFRVSGIIKLKSDLRCKRDYLTIAGQTAPGDGICIRGAKVNLGGSNHLVVRHLRFRVGLTDDGGFIKGGSIGIENATNFIIDHCTFGWSGEENMTIYDNKNTTIQWCIVHEGLYDAGHTKGQRSYGTQWGGQSATYHHNLLANNHNRSPRFNGARSNDLNVLIDYVNNVNFNWGKENSCYGGDIEKNTHRANFVNNYYKPGPGRPANRSSYFVQSSYGGAANKVAEWWMSGNIMEGNVNMTADNFLGLDRSRYPAESRPAMQSSAPFEVPYPVATETAEDAYLSVLERAGAFPRDAVDARIVNEVRTGVVTGSGTFSNGAVLGFIDDPDVVGGYPEYNTSNVPTDADHDGMDDAWELENGLNPNDPEDGNKLTASGYTALEVYLNSLVGEMIPLEFNNTSIEKQAADEITFYIQDNQLYYTSSKPIVQISIYNILGVNESLEQIDATQSSIDISRLSSGVHIFKATFEDSKTMILKFKK